MKKESITERRNGAVYVHVGGNETVGCGSVIGIFDFDTATIAPATRELLRKNEAENRTKTAQGSFPRSFLLLADGKYGDCSDCMIMISPVTPGKLGKRMSKEK